MAKVLFLPSGREVDQEDGLSLLEAARALDLSVEASCGRKGICGKCRVIVEDLQGTLSVPTAIEQEILGPLLDRGYRLACQASGSGRIVVRIPVESQHRNHVILAAGGGGRRKARLKPGIALHRVKVPPPALDRPTGDLERLLNRLEETEGLEKLEVDPLVLRRLPRVLREDAGTVSVAVWRKREIVDLQASPVRGPFGMAFDIGTTTVVGYLLDLSSGRCLATGSAMNPQIPYGDDLITRIAYCQEHRDGLARLNARIIECLNRLITDAGREAEIDPRHVVAATVVGNTAMHHLFMNIDPRFVAMAPYMPAVQGPLEVKAREVGLDMGEAGYVHLLPLKAGFVGSDTIAGILSTELYDARRPTLLVDLGTNGEIVLAVEKRMICCSTAAGPAFEAGHIRHGMRAADGAVDRVRIDPTTLEVEVRTINGRRPIGICGSGLISAAAEMIRCGILLGSGAFNEDLDSERLRRGEDGWEFVLAGASESGIGQDIVVTQRDVAELQMAKSAVCAGAQLLMERFGVKEVDRIVLAGAGGSYVDPADAALIGLFPACRPGRIESAGNAAGHGACLALLDADRRRQAAAVARSLEYQELAASPRFQDLFVDNMLFNAARDLEDGC